MKTDPIRLAAPRLIGLISLEETLDRRSSIREFQPIPLPFSDASQLLWAAQGITRPNSYRTAPSAGATYPLEVLLAAGSVTELTPGLYRYQPPNHALSPLLEGDLRPDLAAAALDQSCVRNAAAVLVITAVYDRTTGKYGKRGIRYVHMEVGYTSENIHLQAVALGLGTVAVGAFDESRVQAILDLSNDEHPLLMMPLGKPH